MRESSLIFSSLARPQLPRARNRLVSRVPSNKCLGVLLDEKLTFQTHIEYICKKVCAGIGALRRI